MDNVEGKDVDGEQGQGQGEQVEVAVVSFAHTVAHPRTVMVKPVWGGTERKRLNMTQPCV